MFKLDQLSSDGRVAEALECGSRESIPRDHRAQSRKLESSARSGAGEQHSTTAVLSDPREQRTQQAAVRSRLSSALALIRRRTRHLRASRASPAATPLPRSSAGARRRSSSGAQADTRARKAQVASRSASGRSSVVAVVSLALSRLERCQREWSVWIVLTACTCTEYVSSGQHAAAAARLLLQGEYEYSSRAQWLRLLVNNE